MMTFTLISEEYCDLSVCFVNIIIWDVSRKRSFVWLGHGYLSKTGQWSSKVSDRKDKSVVPVSGKFGYAECFFVILWYI
jgi:hypothetical protein